MGGNDVSDHHPDLPSELGVMPAEEGMEKFLAGLWCLVPLVLKPEACVLFHLGGWCTHINLASNPKIE